MWLRISFQLSGCCCCAGCFGSSPERRNQMWIDFAAFFLPSDWFERGFNRVRVGFPSLRCKLVVLTTTDSSVFHSDHHTSARMTWFHVRVPNRRVSLAAAGIKQIGSSESVSLHSAPEINLERSEKEFQKENKNGGSLARLLLSSFYLLFSVLHHPAPTGTPTFFPFLSSLLPQFSFSLHHFPRWHFLPVSLSPHVSVTYLISEVLSPFSTAVTLNIFKNKK